MKLSIKFKGDFKRTKWYLKRISKLGVFSKILDLYGKMGVYALEEATPKDTGETAYSWSYEVEESKEGAKIVWSNSNVKQGYPIALLIQYGHGTGTGGYVQGVDYINPAIRPTFEKMANTIWKEVTNI